MKIPSYLLPGDSKDTFLSGNLVPGGSRSVAAWQAGSQADLICYGVSISR